MSSAWKARLLPASFRGIPFFVDSHELRGGRHAIPHEPPDRNSNFTEDLGRKSKVFAIDCHILGDNYFFIRDGLIKAMEIKGKGVLIHPYLGIKEVQPEGYTVIETTGEGRIARFQLTFIEAGEASFPIAVIDAITSFFTATAVAIAQVKNTFQTAFSLANVPAYVSEGFQLQITDAMDTIQNGFKNVRVNADQHSALTKKTNDIKASTSDLANNPASNAQETDNVIQGLQLLVPDPPDSTTIDISSGRDEKLTVFDDLLVFGADNENLPETTPTRLREKSNALAYTDLVQQLALLRLAEQLVVKDFKSNQEAIRLRELVSAALERQLAKSRTGDETFQALEDVNSKLMETVPNPNQSLANEQTLTLLDTIPSLVLAYQLYKSDTEENDIINRNAIRNPAFVAGDLTVII